MQSTVENRDQREMSGWPAGVGDLYRCFCLRWRSSGELWM